MVGAQNTVLRIMDQDEIGDGIKGTGPFIAGLRHLLGQLAVFRGKAELPGSRFEKLFFAGHVGAKVRHAKCEDANLRMLPSFHWHQQYMMNVFLLESGAHFRGRFRGAHHVNLAFAQCQATDAPVSINRAAFTEKSRGETTMCSQRQLVAFQDSEPRRLGAADLGKLLKHNSNRRSEVARLGDLAGDCVQNIKPLDLYARVVQDLMPQISRSIGPMVKLRHYQHYGQKPASQIETPPGKAQELQ